MNIVKKHALLTILGIAQIIDGVVMTISVGFIKTKLSLYFASLYAREVWKNRARGEK